MALDNLKQSALLGAFSETLNNLGELVRSELRLAKAEMAAIVAKKVSAVVWLAIGAVLAIVALIILALAAAAAIAAAGLDLHWALLIVAVVLAAGAGLTAAKGIADAKGDIAPTRTLNQISQDIATAKERMS
jgi:hypothetical protein